jgi:hypothetical protein
VFTDTSFEEDLAELEEELATFGNNSPTSSPVSKPGSSPLSQQSTVSPRTQAKIVDDILANISDDDLEFGDENSNDLEYEEKNENSPAAKKGQISGAPDAGMIGTLCGGGVGNGLISRDGVVTNTSFSAFVEGGMSDDESEGLVGGGRFDPMGFEGQELSPRKLSSCVDDWGYSIEELVAGVQEVKPIAPPRVDKVMAGMHTHVTGKPKESMDDNEGNERPRQTTPMDRLQQLACTCYAIVEVVGLPPIGYFNGQSGGVEAAAVAASSSHVFDMFRGKIPPSVACSWLHERPKLKATMLTAYRTAVKVALDVFTVGLDMNDFVELSSVLEELESDWFIGEEGVEWNEAMGRRVQHMLSVASTKGSSSLLQLNLQVEMMTICSLRSASIRGLWASLQQELLYFTNDDEERYSIQSQPLLLRNLSVSAAHPPLGYPVFGTGPVELAGFFV